MIDVTCHQCGAVYHSEDSHIGKHLRCARCGCGVPIAVRTVNAVEREPSVVPEGASRVSANQAKRPLGRSRNAYLFATIVVILAAGLFFFRGQLTDKSHGTYTLKDIDEPSSSPENHRGNDPSSLNQKIAVVTSPEANTPILELKSSQVEIQSMAPRSPRKHVQEPDPPPPHYHSLPTNTPIGEEIKTKGLGELTVQNGTTEDSVVRVSEVDGNRTVSGFLCKRILRVTSAKYRRAFIGSHSLADSIGMKLSNLSNGILHTASTSAVLSTKK